MPTNRIMVTGGMGFLGSYLAEEFLKVGDCEALCLADIKRGVPFETSGLASDPRVEPTLCDIGNADEFTRLVAAFRPTHVVHAAALLGVNNVVRGPRATLEGNFLWTMNALQAVVHAAPNIRKFVFFSTSEIFGSHGSFLHESLNGVVGPSNDPRWSYAVSKLAGEHLTYGYHREHHFPAVIIRPFNVYGPRRVGDYAVLRFIAAALRNRPLRIHGTGQQIRSWCYVTDFARCTAAATLADADGCSDYNVGNPVSTVSIFELARSIVRLAESSSLLESIDPGTSDIDVRVPDIDKANRSFGYWPDVDLETGLTRTLEWWRAHMDLLPEFHDEGAIAHPYPGGNGQVAPRRARQKKVDVQPTA